uniref:Gustatory receptor n=1 Tax=Rhabditophanes sp. KR3021 TaxID=114890 RepID=A0AC35UH21_9BILA
MAQQFDTSLELQHSQFNYREELNGMGHDAVLWNIYKPICMILGIFNMPNIKKDTNTSNAKTKTLSLPWCQQIVFGTYKVNGFVGILIYCGLAKVDFFKTFVEMLCAYRAIDVKNYESTLGCKRINIIKLAVLTLFYIGLPITSCIINFCNYETNYEAGNFFRTSLFGVKWLFVIDCFITIMSNCVGMLFISLFLLTYWAVQSESDNFTSVSKLMLKIEKGKLQDSLDSLALKNAKLLELFSYVSGNLEKFTNTLVMNSVIIISMSVAILSLYSNGTFDIAYKIEAYLQIISSILLVLFLLKSIASVHSNLILDCNNILYTEQIWHNPYNEQLYNTANAVVQRINTASYTSRIIHLVPANESIVPAITIITVLLSLLLSKISN